MGARAPIPFVRAAAGSVATLSEAEFLLGLLGEVAAHFPSLAGCNTCPGDEGLLGAFLAARIVLGHVRKYTALAFQALVEKRPAIDLVGHRFAHAAREKNRHGQRRRRRCLDTECHLSCSLVPPRRACRVLTQKLEMQGPRLSRGNTLNGGGRERVGLRSCRVVRDESGIRRDRVVFGRNR